ncbi:MAG: DUF937 domain-containing protein [Bacteroidetes bacterium]|nr:DUF937 domain-containing protein [Bacteroidota bacterium]MBK7140420.1 DUF937 domain-containing protein [Bacteroidota bacterium]MBK7640381.1 DUF937 domain-containing protein [Bacteroidota bacterium]MBP7255948.1 DUF937 domain-containing protein [Chitinophagales bacterium]MBP9135515.1 DUF937 domain-containing protein [Chitinophagales bacterium]
MSDLNQLLSSVLNENTVAQIGEQLGVDQNQAGNAIQLALPALLGALNKNAQSEDGAQGILNAISKDHDGGILDMLPQFLGNASQGPGAAILGHILGAKQPQMEQQIGQHSGLNPAMVGKLLTILAPILMGALGKSQQQAPQQQSGGGLGNLISILGGATQQHQQQAQQNNNPLMQILGNVLDKDGDGNIQNEAMNIGKSILGNLFK